MNRVIKFRAWDKKRNIYGKVVSLDMDDSEWFKERHAGHSGRVSLENTKNIQDCGSWGSWIEFVDIEQFTGLLDKNDKEIYEGDIVLFSDWEAPRQVEWNDERGMLMLSRSVVIISRMECAEMTVIGNIHENPELLKG